MTSLLPPSSTALEYALEAAMARVGEVPVPLRALYNPDTCPIELLPYLAWALSIDTWSSDWPEYVKRARVRTAIPIQRRKGTAQSVRDVVASFGGDVAIREWWQQSPRGTPHTFALILSLSGANGAAASAAFIDQMMDEVTRAKPVRSHFTFTLAVSTRGRIGKISVARPATYRRITATAAAPIPPKALLSRGASRVLLSPINGRILERPA